MQLDFENFLPLADSDYDSDSDSDDVDDFDFQRGRDQHVTHTEKFDQHKLAYILGHEDKFKKQMRDACFENDYAPFSVMKKYLESSKKGEIVVTYRQNESIGRFYAEGALSLQGLPREVRHTIASDLYTDIDMVNAHPIILQHLCETRKIKIKYLARYNKNRDKYLDTINAPREDAKTAVLSLMNGGRKAYESLGENKPQWLVKFKKEMDFIHRNIAVGSSYSEHMARREADGKTFNHEASYMNVLLCDFENKILQCVWRGLGEPKDCVLCFDGIMIRRDPELPGLRELEDRVHKQLGIQVQLKVKPMTEGFKMPEEIPKYHDPEYNRFDFTDDYDYSSFRQEFNGKKFESYEAMDEALTPKYRRVVALILSGEGCYIKKCIDGYDITKRLGRSGFNMFYTDSNSKVVKIAFYEYLDTKNGFGQCSCKIDNSNTDLFNTWSGFQAQRVENPSETALAGVELMKSFILESWARSDIDSYKYIVSWMAGLFTNTSINKKALAMISPPGCGKGTMIEFLEFLLRKTNIYNTVGIASITQKHNTAIQGKRLIVVNEMSSTRDEFKSNFDKIKSYITDPTISIEPKGVNPYQVDNISNYVLFTNHRDAIIVEERDRRYAIFEMSDAHINDWDYFKSIREQCFNQEVADAFYTYLLDLGDDKVSLNRIPNTSLRNEMINLSKPTPLKFLDYALGDGKEAVWDSETQLPALTFYNKYVEWCRENGERSHTSTKFGTHVRDHIVKRHSRTGNVYICPVSESE